MTFFQLPSVMQTVQTELPTSVKNKTLLTEIDNLFFKAYKADNISQRDRTDADFAARVWLYAALVDAALNDTAYPAEKYGCEEEWEAAARFLKFELNKRKFLSSVLVHDVLGLCERASASLKVLSADSCGGVISDWVRSNGESLTVFYDIIYELDKHLKKASEVAKAWQG